MEEGSGEGINEALHLIEKFGQAKPAPDLEAIALKHFPPHLDRNEFDFNTSAREACLSALKELMEACGK